MLLAALLAASIAAAAPLEFDGKRAFGELRELVALGPRPTGSPASEAARKLIRERLVQAGWPVEAIPFRLEGAASDSGVNLVARKGPAAAPVIVVVTHFDSMAGSVGANAGASGPALLLELARDLPNGLSHRALWLVFCEGTAVESKRIEHVGADRLASELDRRGELGSIQAVLFVDQVADRELALTPGAPRSADLARKLEAAALSVDDSAAVDLRAPVAIPTPAESFARRRTIEKLSIVDFSFGGGRPPGDSWLSPNDDLRAVSEQSLMRSGRLLLELLRRMDVRVPRR